MSLEQELLKVWYPNEKDPAPIHTWDPSDAVLEFNRDYESKAKVWGLGKSYWIGRIRQAEALIKARIVEATVSPAPYLRKYAELLLRGGRKVSWSEWEREVKTSQQKCDLTFQKY